MYNAAFDWSSLTSGVVGALVGAAGGAYGSWLATRWAWKRQVEHQAELKTALMCERFEAFTTACRIVLTGFGMPLDLNTPEQHVILTAEKTLNQALLEFRSFLLQHPQQLTDSKENMEFFAEFLLGLDAHSPPSKGFWDNNRRGQLGEQLKRIASVDHDVRDAAD